MCWSSSHASNVRELVALYIECLIRSVFSMIYTGYISVTAHVGRTSINIPFCIYMFINLPVPVLKAGHPILIIVCQVWILAILCVCYSHFILIPFS